MSFKSRIKSFLRNNRHEIIETGLFITDKSLKYSNLAQPYVKQKHYKRSMIGLKLLHGALLLASKKL